MSEWVFTAMPRVASSHLFPGITHALLMSEGALRSAMSSVQQGFPRSCFKDVLHCFSVKSNPLEGVLRIAHSCGMGCEVASIGEYRIAERVVGPSRIVFDSPVKTMEELTYSVYREGFINVDNFDELQRIASLHERNPVRAVIGIRVNPQIGSGRVAQTSTATATSKFGVGLLDSRQEIIDAFTKHSFLRMLHVHSGSHGMDIGQMTGGVKAICGLAAEIRARGASHVDWIDIGGGLPVNFDGDDVALSFKAYADALQSGVPELFDGSFSLITEFGRTLSAKAGVLISRAEYVKVNGGRRIVSIHFGADLCVRQVWKPETWRLRVRFFDGETGKLLTDDAAPTDVAGPYCLGGDILTQGALLPRLTPMRDLVVAMDAGGYCHASFSHYNVRQLPPCYMLTESDELQCIQRGATLDEAIAPFLC